MDRLQNETIHSLMVRHSTLMVQLTYRRIGDWQLAEDLVQETFLTACCKADVVCSHDKPVAWLYKTLDNLTFRESRRRYHKSEIPLSDWKTETCEMELSLEYHLPAGLNEQERKLLVARIEEEHSIPEIAEMLGISEAAYRQRLSRAIRRCRKLMERAGLAPK